MDAVEDKLAEAILYFESHPNSTLSDYRQVFDFLRFYRLSGILRGNQL